MKKYNLNCIEDEDCSTKYTKEEQKEYEDMVDKFLELYKAGNNALVIRQELDLSLYEVLELIDTYEELLKIWGNATAPLKREVNVDELRE